MLILSATFVSRASEGGCIDCTMPKRGQCLPFCLTILSKEPKMLKVSLTPMGLLQSLVLWGCLVASTWAAEQDPLRCLSPEACTTKEGKPGHYVCRTKSVSQSRTMCVPRGKGSQKLDVCGKCPSTSTREATTTIAWSFRGPLPIEAPKESIVKSIKKKRRNRGKLRCKREPETCETANGAKGHYYCRKIGRNSNPRTLCLPMNRGSRSFDSCGKCKGRTGTKHALPESKQEIEQETKNTVVSFLKCEKPEECGSEVGRPGHYYCRRTPNTTKTICRKPGRGNPELDTCGKCPEIYKYPEAPTRTEAPTKRVFLKCESPDSCTTESGREGHYFCRTFGQKPPTTVCRRVGKGNPRLDVCGRCQSDQL